MPTHRLRIAGRLDLPAINTVIDLAIASWGVAERVKRLALPIYRYRQEDLDHMWLLAAEALDGVLSGVAALEEADSPDCPGPARGVLLHGIFVKPEAMGAGVGGQLLTASAGVAGALSYDGLLIKSVRQSRGFFERCGLQALPAANPNDYPYRYWLSTGAMPTSAIDPHSKLPPDSFAAAAQNP